MRHSGFEDAFRKRYNRVVIVDVAAKNKNNVTVTISYRDNRFVLDEHLIDGATDYVEVEHCGKKSRFKRYVDAEIYVADKIGEL